MITSAFAFASVISFFNINSTWADENDFNGLLYLDFLQLTHSIEPKTNK